MVAQGFSEEVTLEMKWRRMRRENVLGREQQVQRPGGRKGLGEFKEEQGGRCGWSVGSHGERGRRQDRQGLPGCGEEFGLCDKSFIPI